MNPLTFKAIGVRPRTCPKNQRDFLSESDDRRGFMPRLQISGITAVFPAGDTAAGQRVCRSFSCIKLGCDQHTEHTCTVGHGTQCTTFCECPSLAIQNLRYRRGSMEKDDLDYAIRAPVRAVTAEVYVICDEMQDGGEKSKERMEGSSGGQNNCGCKCAIEI